MSSSGKSISSLFEAKKLNNKESERLAIACTDTLLEENLPKKKCRISLVACGVVPLKNCFILPSNLCRFLIPWSSFKSVNVNDVSKDTG